jgi:hypothetical protein
MSLLNQVSLCLLLSALLPSLRGQEFSRRRPWEAGFHAGVSIEDPNEDFFQGDLYVAHTLPWSLDLPFRLTMAPSIYADTGVLTARHQSGFLFSVGPGLSFTRPRSRFSIDGGCSSAVVSKYEFGSKDLGGTFQFISHASLRCWLTERWSVSYRFQHMSNAGLYPANPGLNLHFLGVGFRF